MEELKRWAFVIFSASLFIASDSFSAKWGKSGSLWALGLMFILAPMGYLMFGLLNRNTTLSVSSGLVNMMLLIGTVLIGIFVFKDELTTRQTAGLVLAFVALGLMSR